MEGPLTSDQDQRILDLCLVELGLFQESLRLSYRALAIWRGSAGRGGEGDAPERVGIEGRDGIVGPIDINERWCITAGGVKPCWRRSWAAETKRKERVS